LHAALHEICSGRLVGDNSEGASEGVWGGAGVSEGGVEGVGVFDFPDVGRVLFYGVGLELGDPGL
jgi:hypothetical protein